MASKKGGPTYRCSECGWTSVKWVGRCGECQAWGSVDEVGGPSAGLVFALNGSIERVTAKVFLLTTSFVEVLDQGHSDEIDEDTRSVQRVEG